VTRDASTAEAEIEAQKAAELAALKDFGSPFTLCRPEIWRAPLIFASPHAGNIYPACFLARSGLSLSQLRANEDAFIDQLFAPAAQNGAPLLKANFPRCYVDVNRAMDELPPNWAGAPAQPTSRAQAGFGVIPLNIGPGRPIYKAPLQAQAARLRLSALYAPYHRALAGLITDCLTRFGRAVVVDCHSMPGFAAMGTRRKDIVLGDRFGLSCAPQTTALFERAFQACGYSTARNHPYAGGFVTRHYGRSAEMPLRAVETLQIEINRDLYFNPVSLAPKSKGYKRLSADLHDIIWDAVNHFGGAERALAAE
jgi:N-formylglutamate amidohydrolase